MRIDNSYEAETITLDKHEMVVDKDDYENIININKKLVESGNRAVKMLKWIEVKYNGTIIECIKTEYEQLEQIINKLEA